MRKIILGLLASLLVTMVGCVTINVYFPEAAAKKAADQFIDNVLDSAGQPPADTSKPTPATAPQQGNPPMAMLLNLLVPSAEAGESPDLHMQTAASEAIRQRMASRLHEVLGAALAAGAVGLTADGLVAVRDAGKLPPAQRGPVVAAVADENRDRNTLYREVASANGHPDWEPQIRATFAKGWIERAPSGWYYQDAAGGWRRK